MTTVEQGLQSEATELIEASPIAADVDESGEQDKKNVSSSANNSLRLTWSFGFNKNLVNGVHNLTTEHRRAIFYPAAHTGVIYDYARRQQMLLQGHCHPISCCVVSEDKQWIVTADRGPESMIVVWDASTGNPIKTIFRPHPLGVEAIDISPDALFIATVSAVDKRKKKKERSQVEEDENFDQSETIQGPQHKRFSQELAVWEWTTPNGGATPLYASMIATEDIQHAVRFNTYDIREIVTNGKQRVIFWSWQDHKLVFYSPSLSQKDFRQVIGNFTQSIFVPDSKQALTGTEDGDLVLWDTVVSEDPGGPEYSSLQPSHLKTSIDRKAVKIVRLAGGSEVHKKVALTHIIDMDGYLVLGSSDGAVRFYDFDFRLVAWFEDMNAGPVMSVSFASVGMGPEVGSDDEAGKQESSFRHRSSIGQTPRHDSFQVPDFVVSTSSAFIVGMSSNLFEEHEPEKRRGTLLMQGINDEIHGLATHPLFAQLALSSYSGVIQLWDYSSKRLIMMRKFDADKLRPHCLTFSPDGRRLFVGFTSGVIKILHAQKLEDITTLRFSKAAVTEIRISHDCGLFVAIDSNYMMGLWRSKQVSTSNGSPGLGSSSPKEIDDDWTYIGRCRSHSKPITGIEFSVAADGSPLLISVAEDKTLVQYSLNRSSIVDGIVLTQAPVKIEQSGTPTACMWHPDMRGLQEDLVIVANDEYKLKQWNGNNITCRKTTLGPAYGGPINRLIPIPLKIPPSMLSSNPNLSSAASMADIPSERYCAYSTHEKVVGLMKLPLDGNPHKAMGLIAHPGEISNIDVSYDGNYLITAGGADLVVNLWDIHTEELDRIEIQGGEGLEPYYSLLEGGRSGEFYNEIVDYFYYAQLRVQGENSTATREITARIPLQEIPNVMRALGFYPTEQEIQHMWSEVKYSRFTETTQTVESIDLKELIKLYINHRPVFGIGKHQIKHAFHVLGAEPSIAWERLEELLLSYGERMTQDELRSCLSALVIAEEPTAIEETLYKEYTCSTFVDGVLGFDDYDDATQ